MRTKIALMILCVSVLAFSGTCPADDAGQKPGNVVSADSIRCERFLMKSVSDLKGKLVEFCDLNKPYSFAGSDPLGGNPMITYCCRKKGS